MTLAASTPDEIRRILTSSTDVRPPKVERTLVQVLVVPNACHVSIVPVDGIAPDTSETYISYSAAVTKSGVSSH